MLFCLKISNFPQIFKYDCLHFDTPRSGSHKQQIITPSRHCFLPAEKQVLGGFPYFAIGYKASLAQTSSLFCFSAGLKTSPVAIFGEKQRYIYGLYQNNSVLTTPTNEFVGLQQAHFCQIFFEHFRYFSRQSHNIQAQQTQKKLTRRYFS